MIEHWLDQGQQVFTISWRNPQAEHREWDLDAYAGAVLEALDAVQEITGAPRSHVMGLCAGGITSSVALAHLAAKGELHDRVAGFSLGVTLLDQERAGTVGAMVDPGTADVRRRAVAAQGLPRRQGAGRRVRLAAPQRPDLELLGQQLPARQAAAGLRRAVLERRHHPHAGRAAPRLHPHDARQRADQARRAHRARHAGRPGEGRRRHLRRGRQHRPHLPVGQLLPQRAPARRRRRASCCRPPATSPRWSTRRPTRSPTSASTTRCRRRREEWQAGAVTHPGSWWTDHAAWLGERSGELVDAPSALGSEAHPVLGPAPGTYVRES